MKCWSTRLLTVIAGAAMAPAALAHVGDIGLTIIANRITTGTVEDLGAGQVVVPGQRVFGGDLGGLGPGAGGEPGLFANVSDGFPPNSELGFNSLRGLRAWNGSASPGVTFTTPGIDMTIQFGPFSRSITGEDIFVSGFGFNVGPSGGFDEHWEYFLNPGTALGVYVLEFELWSNAGAIQTSRPLWIVLNNGLGEAEHDAAIEWVEGNLVPAPGALMLLGAALATRRRRSARAAQ